MPWVGVREQLSDTLALGGGVFSDRSPLRKQIKVGEHRVDYYGVTIALDLTSPYGIVERDGEQFSRAKPLDFGTTLAFGYALGVGELNQLTIGTDSAPWSGEPMCAYMSSPCTLVVGSRNSAPQPTRHGSLWPSGSFSFMMSGNV